MGIKLGDNRMESRSNSLTVVIPAYNEAEALPSTIPSVLEYCKKRHWKLIVVNDGSSDSTVEVLKQFEDQPRMKVIHHKVNRGYGGALKTGLMAVDTDFAVSFDADGQHQLADIDKLFNILQDQNADMIVGSRSGSKHSHWYRELGKWIIRKVAAMMMPMPLTDLNSGFKLYRTSLLQKYIPLCPDSMAFSDVITLIFLNEHHHVIEAPIELSPRSSGKSKISTRTAFETILEIINLVMLLAPLRFFLPVSIICFLFGLVWGIPIVLSGRGVSIGSMLAIVTALILFTIGLVSEQISHLRRELLVRNKPE
jgi:glycosyltransferase involved in cell wall biosynthesis